MLVVGRKVGEEVVIGENVVVKVVSVRGNRISLGIHAPPEVPVHRREVFDRVQADAPTRREEQVTFEINELQPV